MTCAMASLDPDCEPGLERHHILPRQKLRQAGHADKITDARDILVLCTRHHRRNHSGRQPVPRAVLDLAVETGLEWYLAKHYPATETEGKQ